jgi:hypothetical protein
MKKTKSKPKLKIVSKPPVDDPNLENWMADMDAGYARIKKQIDQYGSRVSKLIDLINKGNKEET